MSNRLFSDNEDTSNNQNELSGEDSLKLLVGDGCKYATVEDMAKGMVHSQNHITTLEQEATSFKDAQTKQTSIDDILAAIKTGSDNPKQDDNLTHADQHDNGSEQIDIVQTVKDAMEAQNAQTTASANVSTVKSTLAKSLGDRAGALYSKVGKSLGVDLDKLSEASPQAVIQLVTGQQPATSANSSLPSSMVNQHQQDNSQELTHSKIATMFKDGKITRDAKFKLEHSQAQKLGNAYFD